MKAILILIVAALLAFGYGRVLHKADGMTLQTLGILVLAPWLVILIGTILALVFWT